MILLASVIYVKPSETLQETTCLDEDLDQNLLQMARLHKTIITSQKSMIDELITGFRTELESKIETLKTENLRQEEKLLQYEKNQSALKNEIYNLKLRLNETENKLRDLSTDTLESLSRTNSKISLVNTTLLSKSEELVAKVEAVGEDLDLVESDVDLLKKKGVRTGPDERIDRALLPGSYADFTLEDIAWGSIHAAAAAACRGSVPSGGGGSHRNRVLSVKVGSTCASTCATYAVPSVCDAAVTLVGHVKQATSNDNVVGYYYNYGCNSIQTPHQEISRTNHNSLEKANYMTYCCCRYPH